MWTLLASYIATLLTIDPYIFLNFKEILNKKNIFKEKNSLQQLLTSGV